MKSARSLSRAIDKIIVKEKEKISEYYESQLREKSMKSSIDEGIGEFKLKNLNKELAKENFANTL